MNEPLNVTIGDHIYGNLFRREQRKITVTNKQLEFATMLGGKWPESWAKKDITITKSGFNMVYRVNFSGGTRRKAVLSTYTKKMYFLGIIPYIFTVFSIDNFFSHGIRHHSMSGWIIGFVFPICLVAALVLLQYFPYRQLGKELKKYGYLN